MDKLKLDIQRFAADQPTAGNLIDEECLYEYHQNIKRDYAKKGSNNNFSSSQSITGDLTVSGDITNHVLDLFNDTSGSNWQDMMKNKLDYCINNINTTKTNLETFINGGWSGVNYGFGVFSKIGTVYQLIWFSSDDIYYCRKLGGETYNYRNINIVDSGWQDITLQNGVTARSGDEYKPRYRKIGNVVYVKGQVTIPSHSSTIVMCELPSGYRPICETRMPLMLPYVNNWIDELGNFCIASSGSMSNICIDVQYLVN